MKKLLVCLLTAVMAFAVSGCCDVFYEAFYVEGDTSDVQIDYGGSALYTKTDMDAAVEVIKENFRRCRGCVLHRVRYVSDAECSVQNLERLKALQKAVDAGEAFTQCILFRITVWRGMDQRKGCAGGPAGQVHQRLFLQRIHGVAARVCPGRRQHRMAVS